MEYEHKMTENNCVKTDVSEENWPGRFDEKQYDLLVKAAEKGNMKEWFSYRKKNRKTKILLEGANLKGLNLQCADLRQAFLKGAKLSRANLSKALLMHAVLEEAKLDGANLQDAELITANLHKTRLTSAHLQGVKMRFADLREADFLEADMRMANLEHANLQGANLYATHLQKAKFNYANLKGAKIVNADLHESNFNAAVVDGETLIWDCCVDKFTNFTGVGLRSARIEPQLVSRFETNIRRLWWHQWSNDQKERMKDYFIRFFKSPLKCIDLPFRSVFTLISTIIVVTFWKITDYGSSTMRLLKTFSGICLFFALLYMFIPNILTDTNLALSGHYSIFLRLVRAVYFSIVLMTTVGFGDISANPSSILGHVIVIVHVIIGYTLLGALIVRLGILFESLPVSEISDMKEKDEKYESSAE